MSHENQMLGYDPGTPDGDKSAIIYGKRSKSGKIEVVCVRMGKPEPRRTVFDAMLKRMQSGERTVFVKPRNMGKATANEILRKAGKPLV